MITSSMIYSGLPRQEINRTLSKQLHFSSLGSTHASATLDSGFSLSLAGPDRQLDDYLIRLSTLAVFIVVQGMDIPDFKVCYLYVNLLPTTRDSAFLPLLKKFFLRWTSSSASSAPALASFAAIGQSMLDASHFELFSFAFFRLPIKR